ncbi:hypothetical protein ACFWVP_08460 [Streptomyces sp. NPDC058637]|uniref:hypothetical protein n=1 Tax=Streptomyces sp. NPDC058637 TaxID=3346569 RepID=UPI003657B253
MLDSSGSPGDDGTGRTRMESARTAVATVVDALPDGCPAGLRVYGADPPRGCTDTRLVRPVRKLDPRIGVVLRVAVLGEAPAGPQQGAPVPAMDDGRAEQGNSRDSTVAADSSGTGGAGWTGIATAAGAGAAAALIAGLVFVRSRRRGAGTQTTRGSA